MRLFNGLIDGHIVIPPHTGTMAAAALFAMTGLYGVVEGGHLRALTESTTSAAGFAIDGINVSGNVETSPIDVIQKLGLDGHTSLITLDVASARKAIMELPWVLDAEVRKDYPDVIEIKLAERRAFAIWQHGAELSIIDRHGNVIGPLTSERFTRLPLYVGLGAETNAEAFDLLLDNWPELKPRILAHIRVADRRWDIRLDNGVTVQLPEEGAQFALSKLRRMDIQQDLLERDIRSVDLRLDDRVTIGLTEDAMSRRQNALEARERMLKKGRNS
ncbi:cell division protein FtsQ/DivIB [Hoeflea prorocentri]|uniref:Cell division protein FtsQ n=1 Tax=Hoeflea prorocentri TaxID=1922333 RepID=A0A9X3ZG79_9HYPH|nr:cell division protein FtsQ/DivIB [Hoeflea prorocentri]MCY6379919.1 cell division protein FtsQ/DivIB [Hoeflea prorocentri]MDA5397719.1 cell division protein FtsQ/DivIB [Hoeflea prorocentri]